MKEKAELRNEVKKFKIAQNFHVAKQSKEEFIKKQLKKEQRQLFHRIIANQLAEDVLEFFKTPNAEEPELQADKSKQQDKKNEIASKGRGDDIFIDKQVQDDYLGVDNGGDIDFFDDILNDGIPQKTPLDFINEPNRQREPQIQKRSIKDYIASVVELNDKLTGHTIAQQDQAPVPSHVSRKACLKRINENLRRRLKTKSSESEDRSLTSATVSLSNLINNYPECKESYNFVDLPSDTEWIFDDGGRKKRKDEDFNLNWNEDELQKFRQMNEKFDIQKLKDLPTVLQLTIQKSQYPKLFERNISSTYNFPSTVQSIRQFSQKFQKKKFYYNEFYDQDYERFIRKNNKRRLLEKFEKNSNHMFAQHYVQDQIESNEKISVGKMFLYPPNKISDRLIYKVVPGTTKISIVAKDYNKKNIPLSRDKIILITFLVNKYLTLFGNNWKTITEFIEIFPCFSNCVIKPEFIQEIYQMVNRHELKINHLQNLQIWDKKLLPSSQIYNGSYKDYEKIVKQTPQSKLLSKQNAEMIDQSQTIPIQQETQAESSSFCLDDFQKQLSKPLKSNKKPLFTALSSKYKIYGKNLSARTTNESYNFYENKVHKAHKIIEEYRNTYVITKVENVDRPQNEDKIVQYVQENMKGEAKNGLPFRKKKNINERNNELVKILQALRSKNSSNPNNPQGPGSQKLPPDIKNSAPISKPPGIQQAPPIPNQVPPSSQTLPPKPSENPSDKQQKKSKTPQKRVSGVGVLNANKKKKKDGAQEQKQKK